MRDNPWRVGSRGCAGASGDLGAPESSSGIGIDPKKTMSPSSPNMMPRFSPPESEISSAAACVTAIIVANGLSTLPHAVNTAYDFGDPTVRPIYHDMSIISRLQAMLTNLEELFLCFCVQHCVQNLERQKGGGGSRALSYVSWR